MFVNDWDDYISTLPVKGHLESQTPQPVLLCTLTLLTVGHQNP